ncbi:MAG: hypothetical protein H0S79_08925 [Anaerolineaceae bacterium]|nr:hypothetical protein [Anaerolineaceae bacterium]
MKKFFGVFRYEYKMSIQRPGLWIVVLLFAAFYVYLATEAMQIMDIEEFSVSRTALFAQAGQRIFSLNLFFPVIAGIAAADRAVRDRSLGVRELIRVSGVSDLGYILGKYLGVSFSLLTFGLAITVPTSFFQAIYYHWPLVFVVDTFWATLVLMGPALFFVTAFSLVCPLFMPIRLYQILFTGYWYWGNFLSSNVMFTVSDTLLNASGRYALIAVFDMKMAETWPETSVNQVWMNILVLFICAALALVGMLWVLRVSEKGRGH